MIEFVTLGGALDPEGKRPPIGGQHLLFGDRAKDTCIAIDSGVWPPDPDAQRKYSESVLTLNEQDFAGISLGASELPFIGDLSLSGLSAGDERFYSKYLPDFSRLGEYSQKICIITHAHTDHGGAVAFLARKYPDVKIIMTRPTLELLHWSLHDSLTLTRKYKRPQFYNRWDIQKLEQRVTVAQPGEIFSAGSFSFRLLNAGHILGAVGVEFLSPRRVFVSGDFCLHDQETVQGANIPAGPFDAAILEATYAGRFSPSREEEIDRLAARVIAVARDRAKCLITTLSIGRAPEAFLGLIKRGVADHCPIYIDGAARKTIRIYERYGAVAPSIEKHFVKDPDQRERLMRDSGPMVVISPSGMLSGGHASSYAAAFAEDPRNMIALTSYQSPHSPGAMLLRINRGHRVRFGDSGPTVRFNADVEAFTLSAHGDAAALEQTIGMLKPDATYLMHGDETGMNAAIKRSRRPVQKTFIGKFYQL